VKTRIIKFGGSIITDPAFDDEFHRPNVQRLAAELQSCATGCIVVHGTGLVGKPPAHEYDYVDTGIIPRERHLIASRIRHRLRCLNLQVVDCLLAAGISAVPMHVACFADTNHALRSNDVSVQLMSMLGQGCVPVFYGDMLRLADGRFRVFSSDTMALILVQAVQADEMLFLTRARGVYVKPQHPTDTPSILPELDEKTLADMHRQPGDTLDVSGGMSAKISCAMEIARHCRRCHIASGLEPGILQAFLAGKAVGTRVSTAGRNASTSRIPPDS
jgi:isopentenyl phosphate kinase